MSVLKSKFNINKNYWFLLIGIILAGCSSGAKLESKQNPLTGEEYTQSRYKLSGVVNCTQGELVLKCPLCAHSRDSRIKGLLTIVQEGRHYKMNSNERLTVYIDEIPYELETLTSLQTPREEIEQYPVLFPSGRTVNIGRIREMTRRSFSFYLPETYLATMSASKAVLFEVNAERGQPKVYPMALRLDVSHLKVMQEFKDRYENKSSDRSGE